MTPATEKLYVVAEGGRSGNLDGDVYTLSFNPEELGWENDCNCPGYGLPKHVAEEIARRYNEFQEAYAQGLADGIKREHEKGETK